jgi:hypothetical protein
VYFTISLSATGTWIRVSWCYLLNDSYLQSRLVGVHIQTLDLFSFALGSLIVVCIRTFDCLAHTHLVIFYRPGCVLFQSESTCNAVVLLTLLGLYTISAVYFIISLSATGTWIHVSWCYLLNDSYLQSRLVGVHIHTLDLFTFALDTLIVVCIRTFDYIPVPSCSADRRICSSCVAFRISCDQITCDRPLTLPFTISL